MKIRLLLPFLVLVACGKSSDKDETPQTPLQPITGGCMYYGSILSPPGTVGPSSYGKQCVTGQRLLGGTVYNFNKSECDQRPGQFLEGGCPQEPLALAKCESGKDGLKSVIFLYETEIALSHGQTGQLEAFEKSCENSQEKFTKLK